MPLPLASTRPGELAMLVCAALLSLAAFAGCGNALQGAVRTQGAVSASLAAATTEFLEWDLEKQRSVVEQAPAGGARVALERYRTEVRAPVLKAINASWGALVVLDAAIKAHEAGGKGDISAAIAAVMSAFAELQTVLARLGLQLKAEGAPSAEVALEENELAANVAALEEGLALRLMRLRMLVPANRVRITHHEVVRY